VLMGIRPACKHYLINGR